MKQIYSAEKDPLGGGVTTEGFECKDPSFSPLRSFFSSSSWARSPATWKIFLVDRGYNIKMANMKCKQEGAPSRLATFPIEDSPESSSNTVSLGTWEEHVKVQLCRNPYALPSWSKRRLNLEIHL